MASEWHDAKELLKDLGSAHFNTRTTEILTKALEMFITAKDPESVDPAVRCIRAICSNELELPYSYNFFGMHATAGETPDQTIYRVFKEERAHQDTDFDAVLVLCHG